MSTRFHSKFHRHNHHTDANPDPRYPDSSHDPIASPDSPFLGAFVLQGTLSANSLTNTHSAKIKHNTDTALLLDSPQWALKVDKGSTLVKNVTCDNITINGAFTIFTAFEIGNELRVGGVTTLSSDLIVGKSLYVDTNTLFVNATSNRIGIKTLNPNTELTVVGGISGTGALNVGTGIYCGSTFIFDPSLTYFYANANTRIDGSLDVLNGVSLSGVLAVDSSATIKKSLRVGANTLYVSDTVPRIGINTLTPTANLHVAGDILSTNNLTVGSNVLKVDTSSNIVGINTSSPNKTLTVIGEVSATRHLNVGDRAMYVNTDYNYVGINVDIPTGPWPTLPNNTLAVNGMLSATGNTYVNGYVGINTDSPNKNLTVVGDISATGTVNVGSLNMAALDLSPAVLGLTCQLSSFTSPVTATGEFLILKLNGVQKAIRLWNF